MTCCANPDLFEYVAESNGFVLWRYRDEMPLDGICAPGFFSPMADVLHDDDLMLVESGSGYVLAVVSVMGEAIRLEAPVSISAGVERRDFTSVAPQQIRFERGELAVLDAIRVLTLAIDVLDPSRARTAVRNARNIASDALRILQETAS